jgi:hypothetical protein
MEVWLGGRGFGVDRDEHASEKKVKISHFKTQFSCLKKTFQRHFIMSRVKES